MQGRLYFYLALTSILVLSPLWSGCAQTGSPGSQAGDHASQGLSANSLLDRGDVYYKLGQYPQALKQYQQSLVNKRQRGDQFGEAASLSNLGNVYERLGQYSQAVEHYQQSLALQRATGNQSGEAKTLNNLGIVYERLGEYPQALEHYQQSLVIKRQINDRTGEANSLNNLGNVYERLGQYLQALEHYQQSLAIQREMGDRVGEASSLGNLGIVYQRLGQYLLALEHHRESLRIQRGMGERAGEANSLGNLGIVYYHLGQYPQALKHHQLSSAIQRETGDRSGEAVSLNNLGNVYERLGQYPQALESYQQSLLIKRRMGDRAGEASSLNNLGIVYERQGEYPQALESYQQAISISSQLAAPELIWRAWQGTARTLAQMDQVDSAILAGKQAVNTLQNMRSRNLVLTRHLQQGFLKDKTDTYHILADLLISQGRLPEAEQVMTMLKEEEYFDFIQRDSKDDARTTSISYTPSEKLLVAELTKFNTQLVTLGKEYRGLAKQSRIEDQARIKLAEVEKELDRAQGDFLKLLSGLKSYFKEIGAKQALEYGDRQLERLQSQQGMLAQHQTVIITTVITQKKLFLLLTTPEVQLARESLVAEKELYQLIKRFRNALKHPQSDPLPLAQELYLHLVKPLEQDLQAIQAQTLMWSLDGALRYIPLAALHDGERYLIERYGLSLYTAAAHNHLNENNVSAWRAAGLGVSQAHPGFPALPSVPQELRSIIRQNQNDSSGVLPGEIHLDQDFDRERLKSVIRANYPVLHIASHFMLKPGDSSSSQLLLGDGSTLSLEEFRNKAVFQLHEVNLLTLSACDTAVGDQGTGSEVESFAVEAQLRGANGVLASLWRVEDAGTALLMAQLYRLRSENALSKAESLRQAQISLLRMPGKEGQNFSHPYFWAPFVLMGNWL